MEDNINVIDEKQTEQTDSLSSRANDDDDNRFSIFEEDDEEDEEVSESPVLMQVVPNVINNGKTKKKIIKVKVRYEEEDEEEKEIDCEDNYSHDNDKNNQHDLLKNEPHQSAMSEHKALEEHVFRLDIVNDETSCFETTNQCHLALLSNEKQVNRERETLK